MLMLGALSLSASSQDISMGSHTGRGFRSTWDMWVMERFSFGVVHT